MKDPREYLKGWNIKTDVDLEILISEIQKDAWNAALEAAAKNVRVDFIYWDDTPVIIGVNLTSILKLKR